MSGGKSREGKEREREWCDVGSWKSRGLQNKQAACRRLPCDVTTGQTRDEGRRERRRETPMRLNSRGDERRVTEVERERAEESDEQESFCVID